MLDNIDELHNIMRQENVTVEGSIVEDEDQPNNDRELIDEFLRLTKTAQDHISKMESNNQRMDDCVQELLFAEKT